MWRPGLRFTNASGQANMSHDCSRNEADTVALADALEMPNAGK